MSETTAAQSAAREAAVPRRRKKMHWWSRGSGIRLRVWMVVNVVLLSALCWGVMAALRLDGMGPRYAGLGHPADAPGIQQLVHPQPPPVPDKSVFANPDGKYFGVATAEAPWSSAELDSLADKSGTRPTMTEYFVRWNAEFDPKAVAQAYEHGTLPVLSWEPWEGEEAGHTDQPKYALSTIIGGQHDDYIRRFAQAVAAQKWPVAIRFAHEMNGVWYPWSESQNGNQAGQYVQAWQHVHDVFAQAGAANVIWIWSPNITRPLPKVALPPLYPGDAYVDWVGVTGYGTKGEQTADETFGPTLTVLRGITAKPILITETGREPSTALKAQWVSDFFDWLNQQPDVIGFVWFERDTDHGAKADWRFDETPEALRAFADGIASVKLARGLSG
ncbi:glycoside hydrolase family 26 protein [Kitasatospora sp. SolWspMP-SS2h]|uniref:glycoside hydrolase family 26 protein n=1 Tax=Kitasatospora sp. SolWspMP-SS2h TaxID=1305729 RepID=UPI0011B93EEF|nr:glycosyl hydrolase [Kitasatospora sp. SolWspMP-SS2h]